MEESLAAVIRNTFTVTGSYQSLGKRGITPIFKSGEGEEINDYRPKTLLRDIQSARKISCKLTINILRIKSHL